ncbi:class I SAM-dependent methyltransferase [Streptomyces sp. NPDC004546]|uniref:class I SAM-dependent methyltransferase n=1 Tax=Streptomyces sp. NPDC004546 TaxID=3154282 RepID=UPI0033A27065
MAIPKGLTRLAEGARRRRWDELRQRFPDFSEMTVLDLGGSLAFWRAAPVRPARVTLVNLDPGALEGDVPWIRAIVGDACEPVYGTHDLVISNSLLEHLGGHQQRMRFADAARAAAPRHWVQTPYRYFPVEPHWNFPAMQWLPFSARVCVARHWPLGHVRPGGYEKAVRDVADIELLSYEEMHHYFPESEIWTERFAGMPKSLVAVAARAAVPRSRRADGQAADTTPLAKGPTFVTPAP